MGALAHFLFLRAQQDASDLTVGQEDHQIEVRAIAERVAQSLGLEIFDVQLRRESIGWVLRVILDRAELNNEVTTDPRLESVNIDDCQKVSRDLSAVLDTDFVFEHAYTLEVSSPGLDRPLRNVGDCRRFVGRLVKIVLAEPVDRLQHVTGRIVRVEGEDVIVGTSSSQHRVPWSVVSRARLDVEF